MKSTNRTAQEQLGDSIRTARVQLRLTMKQVASELKITRQAYGQMESGKIDISYPRLLQLSEILKIKVKDLLPEQSDSDE